MLSYILNKKITIEKGKVITNEVGTPEYVWETFYITKANVYVPTRFIEYHNAEILTYKTEFTIRYSSRAKEITNKYRIKYKGDYYKIIQLIEGEDKSLKIITRSFDDD